MMKSFLIAFSLAVVMASPASATAKKKKTTVKTSNTPQYVEASSGRGESSTSSGLKFGAATALGSIGGDFHFGVLFQLDAPLDLQGADLTAGLKTGFLLGPGSAYTTWFIPVLGTATYHFASNHPSMKGYLGVDLGLAIGHLSADGFAGLTKVMFAGMLRPGVDINGKFYAELPFGTFANSLVGFSILPTFGMRF
jgi:hypothetical protein